MQLGSTPRAQISAKATLHSVILPKYPLNMGLLIIHVFFYRKYDPGPVFTKGLRLSQVLGLNPVLKLRLLSQLHFVLK